MKRLSFLMLLLIAVKSSANPLIDSVKGISGSYGEKYSKFEIGVVATMIDEKIVNVFDSSDVAMYALFISPTGKRYRRDAFWMTSYSRCPACPNDVVLEPGEPGYCDRGFRDISENLDPSDPNACLKEISSPYPWSVRFAPPEREI